MRILMWFRSDLRAGDNTALHHASHEAHAASRKAETDGAVISLFIISPGEWTDHDVSPARLSLMLRTLEELSNELGTLNIPLVIERAARASDVPRIVLEAAKKHKCEAIYFNREYEVNEWRRDEAVGQLAADGGAAGVVVRGFTDQVVLAPDEVQKGPRGDDGAYTVFTPYKRAWQARAEERGDEAIKVYPKPKRQEPTGITPTPIPAFEKSGMPRDFVERPRPDDALWAPGEREAKRRLAGFIKDRVTDYAERRNMPAIDGTSVLSPYLAIGAISPRMCFAAAVEASQEGGKASQKKQNRFDAGPPGITTWMSELIWREFYISILRNFPRVSMGRAFQVATDRLEWRYDDEAFERWKTGKTGFPMVDAGMRQLAATGWMHNRVRMLTAMFMSKHLLLNWRLGEKYFMQNLVDGTLASNNGGWQWAASTGTDAAPYFRIFNPYSQSRKFDPEGAYIRRWVPELAKLDEKQIHEPHAAKGALLPAGEIEYPEPMVDHAAARERAIDAFKRLRQDQA